MRAPVVNSELLRWIIGLALGVLGFILGGGWPWKAYRRMQELDLLEIIKPHVWMRVEQEAFERRNEMRHDRTDEMMRMLHDAQSSVLALTGAVERHTEAIKYWGAEIQEVKEDVERLKDVRQ